MLKTIKRVLLFSTATVMALFLVLLVHVVWVVKEKKKDPAATLSLSRVDFPSTVTADLQSVVIREVKAQPGVRSVLWNDRDHSLLYGFDNRQTSASAIFNAAVHPFVPGSKRAIVSAAEATQGCPALGGHSFYGKLVRFASYITG
jgi:hypothetical protein